MIIYNIAFVAAVDVGKNIFTTLVRKIVSSNLDSCDRSPTHNGVLVEYRV